MSSKVDTYFSEIKEWKQELEALRAIILEFEVAENLKWGSPCYSVEEKNVMILGGFKDNCVISFFKGVLMKDPEGILELPGENTRTARVVRFKSVGQIAKLSTILRSYIREAIEVERSGVKVDLQSTSAIEIPEEFQLKLDESSDLKEAFESLTPGRQRGYCLFFSSAKQSKTKEARIEKYIPRILDGKGINDCDCGLSKRWPLCDGTHKTIAG
ncbi:DUF1801 domain-containing protein [Luteolibacter sp. AS25]|uniref:DUF1801 domain-containing protein n=1 Tax=Luteolibacter sp. AS25 TaxID=3135776 RepID=UPI00398B4CAC